MRVYTSGENPDVDTPPTHRLRYAIEVGIPTHVTELNFLIYIQQLCQQPKKSDAE